MSILITSKDGKTHVLQVEYAFRMSLKYTVMFLGTIQLYGSTFRVDQGFYPLIVAFAYFISSPNPYR